MKTFYIIILLILASVNSITFLQPQKNPQQIDIRIGQSAELNYPKFDLKQISRRQIYQIGQNQSFIKTKICQVQKGSLLLKSFNILNFDFQKKLKNVIYNFEEDIKHRQGIIDIMFQNNNIHIVFQNGNFSILQFNQKNQLYLKKVMRFPNVTNLEYGRLLTIANNTLFINSLMAFLITDTIEKINNFDPLDRFVDSIVVVKDKYIVVSQKDRGALILRYENKSIVVQRTIQRLFFQRFLIDIVDLEYDEESNILYVLDANYGAYTVLFYILEDNSLITQFQTTNYHHFNCDNIELFRDSIILSCDQIYKHTGKQLQTYPNPLFKVKQLFSYEKFLIVLGQNQFKVYYSDQYIQQTYFNQLDRFYLYNGKYLGIMEDNVQYGSYEYKPPTFRCQKNNFAKETIVSLALKTQADCNLQYIKKENLSINLKQDERCSYTTIIYIKFWKAGDIHFVSIIIVCVILIIFLIILSIWILKIRSNRNSLQKSLNQYINISSTKDYQVMIQQKEPRSDNIVEKYQKDIDKKEIEQTGTINHDIGD